MTSMPETGMYWHVHHDKLMEYCTSYSERVAYIRSEKPAEEVATRLQLFRPVVGDLPAEYLKAQEKWVKARAEWDKARAEWDKVHEQSVKARAEWDKVQEELKPIIEAMHRQQCPNCPWDGVTIFPASPQAR